MKRLDNIVKTRPGRAGANGRLREMFGLITNGGNLTLSQISNLLRTYVEDPKNGVPQNRKDQTTERGNLAKQLDKDSMTWKTFIKGLQIFRIKRIKHTITVEWPNGRVTEHSQVIQLAAIEEEENENEEPD